MNETNPNSQNADDENRIIQKGLCLLVKALTDPDPLVREQGYTGLETMKDTVPFLDLLSTRLYRRWKSWKRGKPGREYTCAAMTKALHMSVIAQEKQAGARGKFMAFERQVWEREAAASSVVTP